jgi:hypothetical protein
MEGGSPAERKRAEVLSRRRPSWADVVKSVEQLKGEEWETFRERHGDRGRDLALYAARRWSGLTLSELAEGGGLKGATAAAMAVKRYGALLCRDRREKTRLQRVAEMLNVES